MMASPHCGGTPSTCAWGGCFECDRIERVFANLDTGKQVRVQIRKGDINGHWVYRLESWIHGCDSFECPDINEYAAAALTA